MPQSMREARDNPDTWAAASAGAGSSDAGAGGGAMSQAAQDAVVAHLRGLVEDGPFEVAAGSIVKLNDLIGKGSEGFIPPAELLHLATPAEVEKAKKSRTPIPANFLDNLKACIAAAWPSCTVEENSTQREIDGQRFKGFYINGLKL
eukprot:1115876-Prymnesium_polylepis.1